MKILIADDNPMSRRMLELTLSKWGYEVVTACDGTEAWAALQQADAPQLAILDWMMPGLDGLQICQQMSAAAGCHGQATRQLFHIILLTAKGETSDLVAGLEAGANDFVTKPFNRAELQARVQVGVRLLELQRSLADRVAELQAALSQVKQLHGILPICSHCKKIRDDQNYWQKVENYLSSHSDVQFSHGICPDCYTQIMEPQLERLRQSQRAS